MKIVKFYTVNIITKKRSIFQRIIKNIEQFDERFFLDIAGVCDILIIGIQMSD